MGASLDPAFKRIALLVKLVISLMCIGGLLFGQCVVIPRVENAFKAAQLPKPKNHNLCHLWIGSLGTLLLMAFATIVVTIPITFNQWIEDHDDDDDDDDHDDDSVVWMMKNATSSINFCELDFEDSPYIAEPANTVSSLVSYVPLALFGLFGLPRKEEEYSADQSRENFQFIRMYVALLAIGLGSTALHAFLTAEAQAGDEIPMLWYSSTVATCSIDILLYSWYHLPLRKQRLLHNSETTIRSNHNHHHHHNNHNHNHNHNNHNGYTRASWWLNTFMTVSTIVATVLYVQSRDNYASFFYIFITYVLSIMLSFLCICLLLVFSTTKTEYPSYGLDRETFLLNVWFPFLKIMCLTLLLATWVWASEMIFCDDIFNMYMHNHHHHNHNHHNHNENSNHHPTTTTTIQLGQNILQGIDDDDHTNNNDDDMNFIIGQIVKFIIHRMVYPICQYASNLFHLAPLEKERIISHPWTGTIAVFLMNRVVHASWHLLSALFAWILIQALIGLHGFQKGFGYPIIQWYGAPYITFIHSKKYYDHHDRFHNNYDDNNNSNNNHNHNHNHNHNDHNHTTAEVDTRMRNRKHTTTTTTTTTTTATTTTTSAVMA